MNVYEAATLIVAVAFAVLIGYMVPILVKIRKTLAETVELLALAKQDLPPLVREMRTMSHSVTDLTEQLREGVERTTGFMHVVGDVGETVQQVHDTVRGKSGMLLANVASLVAGIRAASAFIKRNSDRS
jgi:uncharacterized protein YoxC